ncbi:MAG: phasin family protein [Acidobacteriota bacterium]
MAKKNVKESSKEIRDSAHKIWLAGLGALTSAEEEGTKLFNKLVEKGESFEGRGRKQFAKVQKKVESAVGQAESSWEKLGDAFDDRVASAINRLGVPSRDEIVTLTKRVEELTLKVDELKSAPRKTSN